MQAHEIVLQQFAILSSLTNCYWKDYFGIYKIKMNEEKESVYNENVLSRKITKIVNENIVTKSSVMQKTAFS